MKHLFLLIFLLLPFMSYGQTKISVVKLKNGTELKGVIKSLDPMDSMDLAIGGVDVPIKMENVASVEENSTVQEDSDADILDTTEDKLVVTDEADYPDSINIKVGNQNIKMFLVRGGVMNMGYDGRHSLSMNSEPVHKVAVTTFYMSDEFVRLDLALSLLGKNIKGGYCKVENWDDADKTIKLIAKASGMNLRLPTEAEWEYAACSPVQALIFSKCTKYEYCSDWYGDYQERKIVTDPEGPETGGHHVVRAYKRRYGKLSRQNSFGEAIFFRCAIKAKDVLKFSDKL